MNEEQTKAQREFVDPKVICKDINDILAVFKKFGVKAYLVYGAVLGSVRNNGFIPWDDDIDLAIVDKVDLRTRKAIGWALFDLGFRTQGIMFRVFDRMEPAEIGYNGDDETGIIVCERNFPFSIFWFKEENGELVCTPRRDAPKLLSTDPRFFKKPAAVKLYGNVYATPGPLKEYLTYTYGDWKTPVKNKHADQYHQTHPDYKYE